MVVVERQFCGPPGTGNGGYVCGLLADHVDGPAEVTLHKPCPLDTDLEVVREEGRVVLMHGDVAIASARPTTPDIRARGPITFDQAVTASRRYVGLVHHPVPGCFVCGTEPSEGKGLHIYAGALDGHDHVVAAPWLPQAQYADDQGFVADRYIWCVLDCPGAFSVMSDDDTYMLLGRLNARIFSRPRVGEACVIQGWKIGEEGRKIYTGTALYGEDGGHLAVARGTWIVTDQR